MSKNPLGGTPTTSCGGEPFKPSTAADTQSSTAPPPRLFGAAPIRRKFVWNEFLLEPTCVSGPRPRQRGSTTMSAEYTCSIAQGIHVVDAWLPWIVFAIRGCVAHCRLETTASPVSVILIGRTSKNFAGTRYLRRGVNEDGHVANHVEVEQIVVVDSSLSRCGSRGRFSSYVQVRGSVPVHWFHGMVQRPKPPILLGKVDPFYNSTRLHLEEILSDFGAPVVLMNLLKTNEKKKREFVLTSEYVKAFSLLTARMEGPRDSIPVRYHSFDLRNAADRAWNSMTAFGEREGDEIGIFACDMDSVRLQSGVVRSNCVDCIDRTNLAQFFFGLHALGKQLTAVGVLHHEVDVALSQQSAYDAMLRLYLRLGDAIAIQYGGSAQVGAGILHRGLGWDKMMGIRRLYNNLVVDKDRQQIMNLFLGLYEPCPNKLRLGDRLTLPLHRKALMLQDSAMAAYMSANYSQTNDSSSMVTPSMDPSDSLGAGPSPRRRASFGNFAGGGGMSDRAPSYWDMASTVVDEATAFAMRRVVDIQEVEADYYLHCTSGPKVRAGEEALRMWWVAPLTEFAARYEHIRNCAEEGSRVSRYSRRRGQPAAQQGGGAPNAKATQRKDSLSSSHNPSAEVSPRANRRSGRHSAGQWGNIQHNDSIAVSPSSPTTTSCTPYYLMTSNGTLMTLDTEQAWQAEAMYCWLRTPRTTRTVNESDDDMEESATADMNPQPMLRATNTRTTLASTALREDPQEYFVPGKLSHVVPPTVTSWQHRESFHRRDSAGGAYSWPASLRGSGEPIIGFSSDTYRLPHTLESASAPRAVTPVAASTPSMTPVPSHQQRLSQQQVVEDKAVVPSWQLRPSTSVAPSHAEHNEHDEDQADDAGNSTSPMSSEVAEPLFVIADAVPEIYWDHGPNYGTTIDLVHNHVTYPDEVHHSIHQKELDELRRACDRTVSTDAKRRALVTAMLRFGDPLLWSSYDLVDALELAFGDEILQPTLDYIRNEGIHGLRLLRWTQWDHFRQAALLREFVAVMRMIPTTDIPNVVEAYLAGPQEPKWTTLFHSFEPDNAFDATSRQISNATIIAASQAASDGNHTYKSIEYPEAPYPCGGIAHAEGTVQFLQTFVVPSLDATTADRFVRFLVDAMTAEPQDANDRRCLAGGIPRQDRLRYHHPNEGTQSPSVAVVHHAFWLSTLLHWLMHNSQRLGINLHCELLVDDARHRAGEFIMWLLYAGLVVPAEHISGFSGGAGGSTAAAAGGSASSSVHTGVDVCAVVVKDVLAERNNFLFTIPTLQRRLVINIPKPFPHHSAQTSSTLGSKRDVFLRVPHTPKKLLQQQNLTSLGAAGGGGSTSEGFSDRDSHGTRASHADPINGFAGGFSTASDIASASPLQFAECCANLAINSLSFLDEQMSPTSIAGSEYHAFSHVVELQHVDLSLLNSAGRFCFFVNIFNTLYIHSWIHALQHPVIDVRRFYQMYTYNIGGHQFSLHEIKHGILRRNRPGPADVLAPFAPGDPRLSLIPNPAEIFPLSSGSTSAGTTDSAAYFETPLVRARILLALMDMYLVPERLPEMVPYSPRLFMDDMGGSVGNQSIVQPIVYDDGFEVLEQPSDSSDEEAGPSTARGVGQQRTVRPHNNNAAGGHGVAFFANLFRRERARNGSMIPQHFCIALVPSLFHEQLNSIEANFVNALNEANQPQTSLNQGNPYPRLIQALIGLEDIGRSPDDIAKMYLKKSRRRAAAAAGGQSPAPHNSNGASSMQTIGTSGFLSNPTLIRK
ncbi:synaptojanin, putative [Bodo saltans]|uniref:Synaptojanin, putative n=1 Tax=Bodo saltans TaxID=75058 RepID=A0A0S4J7V3_BODSA|nr:synaptojanin, putative [Bodo saltans]|eukprot:CUG78759.1 synaptojanin, putative [Bodo saltans]